MKNTTQQSFVIEQLIVNGFITRNFCLRNYISRLGAIICDLRKKGFRFNPEYIDSYNGKDYIYRLENKSILSKYKKNK